MPDEKKLEDMTIEELESKYKESLIGHIKSNDQKTVVNIAPLDPNAASGKKTTGNSTEEKFRAFHERYLKSKNIKRVEYGSMEFIAGLNGFAFTDSDSGCSNDPDDWSPADVYCDLIWQAANCGKQLSGVVTVRACDINAGDGLSVQIKTIDASDMGSALGSCECASCSSNVFSTYTLTLHRYDIYKVVCGLDIFDVGDSLKAAIIQSMSEAFITGIDALIYTALTGANAGFVEDAEASLICDPDLTGSCCTYGTDLFRKILDLEADMRAAGYGRNGFYLILHPSVAKYLKLKEGISVPSWVEGIVKMDGTKLTGIGQIKVIEYCGANECTDAKDTVMAVLLDPERAVGEAYGKEPHLLTDEDPIECDSTKLVMRTYVAIDALDLNAIGFITNP